MQGNMLAEQHDKRSYRGGEIPAERKAARIKNRPAQPLTGASESGEGQDHQRPAPTTTPSSIEETATKAGNNPQAMAPKGAAHLENLMIRPEPENKAPGEDNGH